jgi:hypothetical protein
MLQHLDSVAGAPDNLATKTKVLTLCRSCPGVHHAEASLFIIAAGLLAMFDIRPTCDSEGKPIQLTGEMGPNEIVR